MGRGFSVQVLAVEVLQGSCVAGATLGDSDCAVGGLWWRMGSGWLNREFLHKLNCQDGQIQPWVWRPRGVGFEWSDILCR